MLLTPLLCRFFIKKGLQQHDANRRRGTAAEEIRHLDFMQDAYNSASFSDGQEMDRDSGQESRVCAGVLLLGLSTAVLSVRGRNQFVIDVWMPRFHAWNRPTACSQDPDIS